MSGADDFAKSLEEAANSVDDVVTEIQQTIALSALIKIIRKTPVDTGRARGNWQCAMAKRPKGVLENEDKSGQATINKGVDKANKIANVGDVFYITNNLPYIERLENGWSKQAPAGMVQISLDEIEMELFE